MGTTVEKFDYVFETKSKLKDTINKIKNTLTEKSMFRNYPQELFKGYIDVLNNGTENLWNNLNKVSGNGTEIILENTEAAPMKVLLSGNTIQNGTPTSHSPIPVQVVTGNNIVSVSGENQINRVNYPIDLVEENLFDKDDYDYLTGYIANTSGNNYGRLVRNNNTTDVVVYVKTKPNTIYILKKILTLPENRSRFRVAVYSTKPITQTFDMPEIFNVTSDTATEQIINTGNDGNYLYIQVYTSNTTTPLKEVIDSIEIREVNPIYKEMCQEDYFYKQNNKWYIHKGFGKATDESGSTSITISDMISDAKVYSYYGGTVSGNTITYDSAISGTNYIYYPLQTPIVKEITSTTLIEQLEAIFKAKSSEDKTYISQTNEDLPFKLSVEAIKKYD